MGNIPDLRADRATQFPQDVEDLPPPRMACSFRGPHELWDAVGLKPIGPMLAVSGQNPDTMEMKDDLTQLNNLRDLLEDSREGYIKAAERVEDPQVKRMLVSLSTSRLKLIQEVDDLRMQADPEAKTRDGGTIKGDLHRAWIELRDSMSKSDNANVLHECERGEEYLIGHYEDVDAKDVHPNTFALCQRQRAEVQGNLGRIKALAHTFENIEK